MVFFPGEHALQENVTVRGVGGLAFIGHSSSSPTNVSKVICTDARFTFTNTLMLEIADLGFHSCTIQLDTSSAVFKNSSFENSISEYGGAIYAHSSTIIFDGQTQFEGNKAAVDGGGIFAGGSNLTFHGNTTFINNAAVGLGGGIYMIQSDFKFVGNASFIANNITTTVTYLTQFEFGGGGICAYNSSLDFNFESTFIFLDNSAANGGGLLVNYSTVSFNGVSQFINNSAVWEYAGGGGGGLSVWSGSNVSFGDNSIFISNSAKVGGGVDVVGSNVSFGDNTSFFDNSAVSGGGVFAVQSSNVSFGDNSIFISNSVEYSGGGVYVSGSNVSFGDDSSFNNNSVEYDGGGGVHAEQSSTVSFGDNSTFIDNSAGKNANAFRNGGGGVSVEESTVSFGDNSGFINNSALWGGGVRISGSNVSFGDGSSFNNNSAEIDGGGVCVMKSYAGQGSYSTVSFGDNSTFIDNSALWGGGVVVYSVENVSFGDNSTFIDNSAKVGGGIAVYSVENVSFGDNSSFNNNSAVWEYGGSGGGIAVLDSIVSFGDDSSFNDNSAGVVGGGGVFVSGSNVSFGDNSTFIDNSAEHRGGGVYVLLYSTVSFGDDTSFIDNSEAEYRTWYGYGGGGVNVEQSTVSFGDNSGFINNSAVVGGGVRVSLGSTVSFGDSSGFINNSAEVGGGVYVDESTVSFGDGSSFNSNAAGVDIGGGVYVLDSNVSFGDDNSFNNNSADGGGGGVAVLGSNVSFGGGLLGSNVSFGDNSSFNNNSAVFGGGVCVLGSIVSFGDNSTFIDNSVGDGGGGGVFVSRSNMSLGDNSSFINNSEGGSGGGGVVVSGSVVSFGDDSTFINNSVGLGRGGSGGGVSVGANSTVSFGDSDFIGNLAVYGGGVSVGWSHVSFGDSNFTGNSADYFGGCMSAKESTIDIGGSGDFMNNLARYGGCIFAETSNLTFTEATVFSWNSAINNLFSGGSGDVYDAWYGGAILALGSDLTFGGSHELAYNSAGYGGAIYLTLDNKIFLLPNTTVSFENNHAQYRGGALFVEDNPFTYCIFDEDLSVQTNIRDICFIQMHMFEAGCVLFWIDNNSSHLDQSIQLQFQDNSANETGSVLYGGNLDSCGVCSMYDMYAYVSGEVAFSAWGNISNNLMSSDPYRLCICVDNHPDCSQSNTTREIFPGETIGIPVAALGRYDGIVPAVIQTYTSEGITLDALQRTQQSNNTCMHTNLQYTVRSTRGTWNEATLTLYADGPCSTLGFPLEVFVTFLPCPLGFSLSTEGSCECDQRLNGYEVYCDINDQSILRKDSVWIGFNEQSDNKSQGLILHPHCPFDYCKPETDSVNFTMNNTDLQCNYNRSGHLCGACQRGLSLAVGSSQCLPCSNKFLALLLPFVIAGLALVVFLFICKVTVAAGTISGLIFYANIVTVNQSIFFPSGQTNILTVFIAWLNLDLGIETCFFDGMDAYSMTWLQFVFPIYIWLLVGLVAILCNYSTTAARILGSTNPIAVLATLFLLSYTKLLRTIIAAFSFTTLEYPDDEIKVVWLYDGNIGYLDKKDGRHIALFLASLLVFLFLFLPYTLFLLLGQCILPRLDLNKLRWLSWGNYLKMKSFLDAHHAPYKDRHRYWIGLLLVLRFILFLITAIVDMESPQDPHVNLLVIIVSTVLLAIFAWNAGGGMYKKWYLNALESSFIFNLIILAAATLYAKLAGGNQAAVSYTSVTIAFTTFIGIIIYHVYQRLRDSRAWRNLVRKHNERRRARYHGWQSKDCAADEEMEEMIPQAAPSVSYVDIPTEERRKMRPITPPQSPVNSNIREQLNHLQREDAATDEEMEEMLPQAAPTVTYVDIPADERIQMRPITPPLLPVNLTDVQEHLQRKDAAADDHEEVEREVPQVTPTVTYIPAIPAAKAMHPITPAPPPINFTDLREPLDLLTQ